MGRLTRNIVAVPVALFLIVVLSAPELVIHHVHHIESNEPSGHNTAAQGHAVDVPTTYHETHIVTLLSGDSFNSSTHADVTPPLQKFTATLPLVPTLSSTHCPTHRPFFDIRPLFQRSQDKCVLFCSFLI